MNHPYFGWSWGHSLVARGVLGTPPLVGIEGRDFTEREHHSRSLGAPSPHGRAPGPWGTSMSRVHSPPNPGRHTDHTQTQTHTSEAPPPAWRPHPHQPWYSTEGPLSPAAPGSRPPGLQSPPPRLPIWTVGQSSCSHSCQAAHKGGQPDPKEAGGAQGLALPCPA